MNRVLRCAAVVALWAMNQAAARAEPEYRRAVPGAVLQFPRDHGSHPEYQTEWWYFTGTLYDGDAKPFESKPSWGFELTFFRRSVSPGPSGEQVWLAHAALSELGQGRYLHEMRLAPDGLSVAGAAPSALNVWNSGWRAESFGGPIVIEDSVEMDGARAELRLILENSAVMLNGEAGFSKKGECSGCASYYYSMPALRAAGVIRRGGKEIPVHGAVWMDHEYMSNALSRDQSGWDWFGLALRDGRRLMLFRLRGQGGARDYAAGTLFDGAESRPLSAADFSVDAVAQWKSPHTGATYPAKWRIRVPSAGIDTEIASLLGDQEFVAAEEKRGVTYWEGAVSSPGGEVVGYAELTGYAKAMDGAL